MLSVSCGCLPCVQSVKKNIEFPIRNVTDCMNEAYFLTVGILTVEVCVVRTVPCAENCAGFTGMNDCDGENDGSKQISAVIYSSRQCRGQGLLKIKTETERNGEMLSGWPECRRHLRFTCSCHIQAHKWHK